MTARAIGPDGPETVLPADAIDEICDRFECAWKAGQRPDLRDSLASSPALSGDDIRHLATELLLIDIAWRWRGGKPRATDLVSLDALSGLSSPLPSCPRLEDYVARYRELGSLGDLPDRVIAEEYRVRRAAGERPNYCEYVRRFHSKGCRLRQVLAEIDEDIGRAAAEAYGRLEELPRTLGRYVLLELLGRGGMGAVYKATHTSLNRLVAIKLLPVDLLGHPEALGRFQREVQAVGRLNHPHLVRALDAGKVNGMPMLIMEYVEGCDVGRLLQQRRPLPLGAACEIVRQTALGLQYVHQQGLVHRDIKPANMMLARDGPVRILDLGLAHIRGDMAVADTLTRTGQLVGTFDYVAPEQILDPRTVDGRADIYSLGCSFFEMLSGRTLFDCPDYDTPGKKLIAQATVPPPSLARWRPDTPPQLLDLLDRMLAKSPDERLGTAGHVIDRLGDLAQPAELAALLAQLPERQVAADPLSSRVTCKTNIKETI